MSHPINLVVNQKLTKDNFSRINLLLSKTLGNFSPLSHLWQEIQHIDKFFDAPEVEDGIWASFDRIQNVIDFHDEDGTLMFYLTQNHE